VSPSLLMQGDALTIVWAVLTAALGIWMGTIGVVGFYSGRIAIPSRVLYVVAGLLLLIPSDAFRGAFVTDLAGLALGGVLLGRELLARRARGRKRSA